MSRTSGPKRSGRRAVRRKTRPVVVTVFGTRPQFVKLSAIWPHLEEHFRSVLIDSGQHYDHALAGSFHETTGLRRPDHHLGIGSCPAAVQIGRIAAALDRRLRRLQPAAVLVFGDTSTTAGAALAAAYRNIPLGHIEAGLRSHDHSMPEEKNRLLADQLAQWRFAPTETAVGNLRSEGMRRGVMGTGDLMFEHWRSWQGRFDTGIPERVYGMSAGAYLFMTCHRAATVDDPERLRLLVGVLRHLDLPTVFAVHPRARRNLQRLGLWRALKKQRGLSLTPPLPYDHSLSLACSARAVLTDSGGLQREAYWFRTPCLILRDRTEWTELVACGAARLVDLDRERIHSALCRRRKMRAADDRFFRMRHPSRRIVRRLVADITSR